MKIQNTHVLPYLLCGGLAGLALPAAAGAPQPADLTEIPFEQLLDLEVITASRIPQKISEAPSAVSVITAEDMRRQGYRSLADVLRSVRGVYVTYDRNYSYVGTRGSGRPGDLNTRLLILVDGRRLNDVVYDQGVVGTEFPVDIELIERVEFVPGPGSALYGSSAFFGVVNVITKNGAALAGTELAAGAGSEGAREARFATGKRFRNGVDLLLSASWFDRPGTDQYFPEYDSPASNHGIAQGLDYDRTARAFAKLSYRGLGAELWLGRRTKGIPTASWGQSFNDPRARGTDEYAGAILSYQKKLSDRTEVFGSLHLSHYRYSGNFAFLDGEATLNIDASNSQTVGAELRVLSTAVRGHKLIAGAEYLNDTRRSIANYDIDPFAAYLDVDRPRKRAALYVQDEMRLGERIVLNTGLRHDDDSENGHTTNPRLAVLFKATPQVTLKSVYGTAYRSANAYERYYATTVGYKLNPELRSERIKTVEMIAEYFPTERFRASASLFRYRLRDLIALTVDPADGLLYYSNIDAARSRGVELETEWRGENGSSFKGSAAFQSVRNADTGEWLSNSPRRLFKLNYAAPLLGERLHGALEYQFTSRRLSTQDEDIGGFGVLNLTLLGRTANNRVEVALHVGNVLDKRYADTPSEEHYDNSNPPRYLRAIRQDRRNWRLTASFRF